MMDFSETEFDSMNLNGQYQPSSAISIDDDLFKKILADISLDGFSSVETSLPSPNLDNSHQHTIDPINQIQQQIYTTSINGPSDFYKFEQQFSGENFDQSFNYRQPSSIPTGHSPTESQDISNLTCAQTIVNDQNNLIQNAGKTKKAKRGHKSSTTVTPIDYALNVGGCQPCAITTKIEQDYSFEQLILKHDAVEPKKIQISCQPRGKFRPRTQNESRVSSHYIRCEDGVKPEYPTITLSQQWRSESVYNFIEVALMGIDCKDHLYSLENKNSSNVLEENTMIFKEDKPNTLFFRLTDEDFNNGFKTFLMQLIKSRQDETITKDLIRTRKLEQSMLRFTRIYLDANGSFQRDNETEEYSNVMTEGYGDVEIEHLGPRRGPMMGNEMFFAVFKGRFVKSDIVIEFYEKNTQWIHRVDSFTKNGNVIYFQIPAFPYPQLGTAEVDVIFRFQGDELPRANFLYQGSIDQDLAALRLDESSNPSFSMAMPNNFSLFNIFAQSNPSTVSKTRRSSKPKASKRLQAN